MALESPATMRAYPSLYLGSDDSRGQGAILAPVFICLEDMKWPR